MNKPKPSAKTANSASGGSAKLRAQAAKVIANILKQQHSLASLLPEALDKTQPADRPLLQQLCYGTCRFMPALQILAEQCLQKPFRSKDNDVYGLLLIGLYQLLHTEIPQHAIIAETVQAAQVLKKPWGKGLLNAIFRRLQREPELVESLASNSGYLYAHPHWLIKRLKKAWPDDWQQILAAGNQQGPMTLRVNTAHQDRDAYAARLQDAEIAHQLTKHSNTGITLAAATSVDLLPGFHNGDASVQDEAAQLAAPLLQLQPQQRVLDACAAPGGKTCHILETEPKLAQCLALDVSPARLDRVRENLQRLQLECDLISADASQADWWDGVPFDRILLDAPCSATGVIRRNPDIKQLRRDADIAELAALQYRILENLWGMLKPGGLLVYATCSVLPDENEQVVARFLEQHCADASEIVIEADWGIQRPQGRQLFPQAATTEQAIAGHDGFYYAVISKRH